MNELNRTALPLSEAASRLGITPDAVRMRFRRGKIKGFRENKRIYIQFEQASEQRAEQSERYSEQQAEQSEQGLDALSEQTLEVIVELQRTELTRILGDNERLNRRVDEMMDLQRRQQVLQQQTQNTLENLSKQLDRLPSPETYTRETRALESRLQETESNFGMLKSGLFALLAFLERKRA